MQCGLSKQEPRATIVSFMKQKVLITSNSSSIFQLCTSVLSRATQMQNNLEYIFSACELPTLLKRLNAR